MWPDCWSFASISIFQCCYLVTKSCLTLCDPMDCSPSGSSVHGILPGRILEWVAISSSRGSFWPRDQTSVSCISCVGRLVLYHQHHLGSPESIGKEIIFYKNTETTEIPLIREDVQYFVSWLLLFDHMCEYSQALSLSFSHVHAHTHTVSQMRVLPCIQFFIIRI